MAGALRGLKGFVSWYQGSLARHPVPTQVITSGVLWGVGDVIAQGIELKTERNGRQKSLAASPHVQANSSSVLEERNTTNAEKGLDLRRVCTVSLFGFGFVGPLGHYWYEALEFLVRNKLKLLPKSVPFIAAKVFVDCCLFGPIHLLAFFTYAGLASGKSFAQVKEEVKRDFIPSFLIGEPMWFIVQGLNFRLIPVKHQLLFVNFGCVVDSTFLSWVKHQEDAAWKRRLRALVTPKTVKEQ